MGVRSPRDISLASGEAYQGLKVGGTHYKSGDAGALTTSFRQLTVDPALFAGAPGGQTNGGIIALQIIATCSQAVDIANDSSGSNGVRTIPANEEFELNLQAWVHAGAANQTATYYVRAASTAALNYRILWGS